MSDGPGLFGPIEARGLAAEAVGDVAFVRAMLRTEAAIAAAQADAGLIPRDDARAIDAVCRGPAPQPAELGAAATTTGTPVVPLLDALRARLDTEAATSLHRGATSQDVVDTASMLTASGAVRMILADLEHASRRARELAAEHATTPMAGRTLLQHARPTTFGARAATWADALEAACAQLMRIRDDRLAVQLAGPVGSLEGFGEAPEGVVTAVAVRLGLAAPDAPWHADRGRVVDLAGALGMSSAAVASCALDLVLLAQTEVAEVSDDDPGRGGSSSMSHKRNPVAAVLARAAALRAPGLVANLVTAASSGEHERAAGAWHAEWRSLRELLLAAGSAAAWLRDALEHLLVDADRMRRNLDLGGDLGDVEGAVAAAARLATRPSTVATTARATAVHHVVEGPAGAPPVVLGNSLGSTLAMWDAVAEGLRDRFRVVRYDLRGHGDSPAPPGPYAIDDLGADLVALLDEFGASSAHLVGTSIGGMAAMWAASRRPERVDRLVVIGSSPRLTPSDAWIERARTVLAAGTDPVAEAITPRWVSPAFATAHPDAMAAYRRMFAAADPAGYAGCCLAIAGMDLTDALAAITAPTLVVVGSEDSSTPPEHAHAIAAGIGGARMATIEGAAHVPAIDHPEEIVRLITEHLA